MKGSPLRSSLFTAAVILLLFYMVLNRFLSKKMIGLSQSVIHDLRLRLIRASVGAQFGEMKKNKELLVSAITKEAVSVSQAALSSVYLITSGVTVFGSLVYLGFLSLYILGAILCATALGTSFYLSHSRKNQANLQSARKQEDSLFHHVGQVLNGFREIKVNPEKGGALIEGPLLEASLNNQKQMKKGLFGYFCNSLTGQFVFYLTLILILYSGSGWFKITPAILVNCVFVILYLIGPLEVVMILLPTMAIGEVAASRLNNLLSLVNYDMGAVSVTYPSLHFDSLSLRGLYFDYAQGGAEDRFKLGPIDFELKRGETVFIFGGNGSGKTTFFHIVLGLIGFDEGKVFFNGQKITGTKAVQHLFSPLFSDFYLFDRFYGHSEVDPQRIGDYLELFELKGIVTFDTDRFSTLELSTGQRKRLALIYMLMENRYVLLLDEWAADQDPFFREKFYRKILPVLKKQGFTILAITHDDKYYHTADRLYKMENGKLLQVNDNDVPDHYNKRTDMD
jgi:putative ATP-binding cassette transporter